MAKQRNTDTEIWKDPWFRKLPPLYKTFWRYLCDNVDDAGVWKEDLDLAAFLIGESLDKKRAFFLFNETKERLKEFKPGYWCILSFIPFHYGELQDTNNFHKKVLSLVRHHGIQGLVSPSPGAKDTDKGKGKGKDTEGDSKGETTLAAFEVFWNAYPARNGKKLLKSKALIEFQKLDQGEIPALMQAVKNYADSGQYPKDPPRFFKDGYWRDWIDKPAAPQKKESPVTCPVPGCMKQMLQAEYLRHREECEKKFRAENSKPLPPEIRTMIDSITGKKPVKGAA